MRVPLISRRPETKAPVQPQRTLAPRLEQECAQLTAIYRTPAEYGLDPVDGWWVHLTEWSLPAGMNRASTPIIVMVSPEYPAAAPTALFVPDDLASASGWKLPDLLPAVETEHGPERWSRCALPYTRWREGDDLDRVLTALYAVLQTAAKLHLTPPSERGVDN